MGTVCSSFGRCDAQPLSGSQGSPGRILDDEVLIRASYAMHDGNPPGPTTVRRNLIHLGELRAGQLSIWRLGHLPGQSREAVEAHLSSVRGEPVHYVFGIAARAIRAMVGEPDVYVCALDDTNTGKGHDKAHAALSPCHRHELDEAGWMYHQFVLHRLFVANPLFAYS
jgi:hypothetical protein